MLLELPVLDLQLGPAGLVGPGVLLGRALPGRLGLIQFGLQLTVGPIQVEQLVYVQVDALDPDGRLDLVRVLPDKSLVQHGYASALSALELPACPVTKRYQQCPSRRPA